MFTATSLEAEFADFETQIYKKLAEIDEWNEFNATLEAANTSLSVVPEYPHTGLGCFDLTDRSKELYDIEYLVLRRMWRHR